MMAETLRRDLPSPQRKSIARASLPSESLRKGIADGHVIERAIELSGKTKQSVADAMGYTDASSLSRWISGAELPTLEHLQRLDKALGGCWFAWAWAEWTGRADLDITIRPRRPA